MDKNLTLVEHLSELRKRIIICLAVLILTSVTAFPFTKELLKILKLPARGLIQRLAFFGPQEAFLVHMRLAFFSGFILSIPFILYHIWSFINPALEGRINKFIVYFVFFCTMAFAAGCFFAYFVLIPPALKFFLQFAGDELEPIISVTKYISLLTGLILCCGIVFQMPVISFIFTKIGVINAKILRKYYKYAIITIAVVSAVITPTADIFNMMMLVVPMIFLYEASVWVSYFAVLGKKKQQINPD